MIVNIEKLYEVRKGLGFSQEELASKASVSYQTIYRYEKWKFHKMSTLQKIVDIFNAWRRNWPFFTMSDETYTIKDFLN